jgi:hypothetical protein
MREEVTFFEKKVSRPRPRQKKLLLAGVAPLSGALKATPEVPHPPAKVFWPAARARFFSKKRFFLL